MSSRFTSSSIERYNDFSRLNPAIVGWHVHVKVLRRFHTDDYISKGGLGLLLVDDKGNQIEALICSPLTSHYSTFIEEDEFYTIMNFRVVENSGFTKLTRSDFKIMFYDGTIVKEASSFSQDDYIVATPFGAIFNGYHDTSYLITLIGRIVEASDLTNVTDEPSVIGGYRYSFTIEDQEYDFFHRWKKTLKCCAYGEVAIECHDRFRNVIGTDVTCVLRWWKVYQLLDGWRHVRIYSHSRKFVRTTPHRFKIQFSPDTCVEYLNYIACDYDYFSFARFRDIRTGISNPYICVDLVGRVDNVNDIQLVQMVGSSKDISVVYFDLIDTKHTRLSIRLTGETAVRFHRQWKVNTDDVVGSGCGDGVLSQFLDVTSDPSCLPDVEENVKEYLDDVSDAVDLSSVLHVEASAAVLSFDEFKDVLSDLGALSADKDYVLAVLYLRFVAAGMKPYPSDGLECDEILMNTNEDTLECINDIVISSWRLCPAYLRLRFAESLILYTSINVQTVWNACYRVLSGDVLAEQKIARLELSDVQLEWYGFRVMRKVMGDLGFHHAGFEGVRLGIVRRLLTYKCDDMSM
ncbi:unnamed protein product [Arabidopsis arenosa]|uniref:Replication protein A 70 kDa DNA-binding subunit B/D first OB fold domain-containing protein n=1 Tax=Arabidopsis arenosa TaxID=38785 RepID=A0A8S1ZKA9_ARAAE|nr:unnamed protein product [Arabidopsis arenosa]